MTEKHPERYLIITRADELPDSEWVYITHARNRAKKLRKRGVDCDIYAKVIE